jgi:membrane fusion protein (multidrug efflux system)
MILGANNMAEVRVLKISRSVGNQWLVTEGLKPGEKLIVTNLQKVRPGAPTKPSPFVPPPPTPATVQ